MITVADLLKKTPKNRNGIRASYQRGRVGQTTKHRTAEGLAAWFLGFAEMIGDDSRRPLALKGSP